MVAYGPALSCGFIWDDDDYVEHNAALESPAGLVRIWTEPTASPQYYPLVFTTFWIERRLWNLDPAGYHAVNVLLHAASGVLLWRILRRLAVPAAWFAAALFVLHPVEVESVAWITERKNVLSGFFYLAAALSYLRFRPPDRTTTSWPWYAASLALFALALLSKTVTCSLPAALLLVYWWKRPRLGWSDIGPLVPMFVLGAGLAYVTVWMEKHKVGAQGVDFDLTPVDRILIAGRAVCFYLGKLAWPTDLAFIYPRWTIDPTSVGQWAYPVAVVLAIAPAWCFRRQIGKGPLVALLFFVGTLVPALGFIDVYPMKFSFVADHFQYLAGIGPLTLVAVVGARSLTKLFGTRPGVPVLVGAGWLAALGMLTWSQCSIYFGREPLWIDTVEKNPESALAQNGLGEVLFERHEIAAARLHFQEANRLAPREAAPLYGIAKTYGTDGNEDPKLAKLYCEAAIRLKPDYPEARCTLGLLLRKAGKTDEAIEQYEKALAVRPDFGDAHNNLGAILASEGRQAEAIPHFEAAVKESPGNPNPRENLARAYAAVGRTDEARVILRRLILEHPQETKYREMLDKMN